MSFVDLNVRCPIKENAKVYIEYCIWPVLPKPRKNLTVRVYDYEIQNDSYKRSKKDVRTGAQYFLGAILGSYNGGAPVLYVRDPGQQHVSMPPAQCAGYRRKCANTSGLMAGVLARSPGPLGRCVVLRIICFVDLAVYLSFKYTTQKICPKSASKNRRHRVKRTLWTVFASHF